ncbi:hypothetical protein C5748_10625 [Phyllobacterium phragmitis]|uniref:Aminotransferase class I/classII large domain-containing protein n=1 Tax=Phyllobacterium phragmitis TaxID=2670329 RepID=A0A2S9IT33_9HYPH|nr:PLP-dependent aminotransferase family protein [Phyllobacterium phragmitis]PRD43692.1 hypothetical protein C5748_10625 [Phyllobacterium phragmitis]
MSNIVKAGIDLRRVTSPVIPHIDQEIAKALHRLQRSWSPSDELRQHRKLGTVNDRRFASHFLSRRYVEPVDEERVFLVSGTQNALFLLLSAMRPERSTIIVEELAYRQIREVAAILGMRLVGVETDADGIVPRSLEDRTREHPKSILYCTPTVHNPTATIMPEGRRTAIIQIARSGGVPIIEDEAQGLIPLAAPPPLSEMAPDITWTVTGLSKCLFVGLRIAYVVAPSADAIRNTLKDHSDMAFWYSSAVAASLTNEIIASGAAELMLERVREEAVRRQELADRLLLGSELVRGNGLHLWIDNPERTGNDLREEAAQYGVLVRSASEYAVNQNQQQRGIRASLADVCMEDLSLAFERLNSSTVLLGSINERKPRSEEN